MIATPTIDSSQTTQDDYYYLTEGMKFRDQTGADFKSGHELKEAFKTALKKTEFTFYLFNHIGTNTTKALSVKIVNTKKDETTYLCVPFDNATLYLEYFEDRKKLKGKADKYYDYVYTLFTTKYIQQKQNETK